ncbi:hypothetical protein M405DRAFT_833995, partial [Rhizopogon salebrosus TDB-379]
MFHSELHQIYHGARQGPNHISRLHGSFVSIDPEWASHEIEFHGIKFIPVFRWDWPLFRFGVHYRDFVIFARIFACQISEINCVPGMRCFCGTTSSGC